MEYIINMTFLSNSSESTALHQFFTGLEINLFSDGVTTLLGAIANLWLFACIITMKPLASKPRNLFICSITIAHLLKVLYFLLLQFLHIAGYPSLIVFYTKCAGANHTYTMNLMEGIVVKFTILIMCSVYLYQVLKFAPEPAHSRTIGEINQMILIFFPWAVGLVTVQPNLALFGFDGYPCLRMDANKSFVFLIIYSLAPIMASMAVILSAVLLRRILKSGMAQENVKVTKRWTSGQKLDSPSAYVTAVAVCVLCEACQTMRFWGLAYSYSWG
ncbi:hypothetical protein ElyMa_006434900 [Elysia marginata]|uniref:G-protein coupled receptors family 1 profile domain-containing protein n=1 Tax=Elysia marginata TaxID=1093978 RepID=A0AAV4HVH7_9GAST|nr:hypothetical protein ElyMa_006434900 [Elysia marginata]